MRGKKPKADVKIADGPSSKAFIEKFEEALKVLSTESTTDSLKQDFHALQDYYNGASGLSEYEEMKRRSSEVAQKMYGLLEDAVLANDDNCGLMFHELVTGIAFRMLTLEAGANQVKWCLYNGDVRSAKRWFSAMLGVSIDGRGIGKKVRL